MNWINLKKKRGQKSDSLFFIYIKFTKHKKRKKIKKNSRDGKKNNVEEMRAEWRISPKELINLERII
jgi:hypothetical protein